MWNSSRSLSTDLVEKSKMQATTTTSSGEVETTGIIGGARTLAITLRRNGSPKVPTQCSISMKLGQLKKTARARVHHLDVEARVRRLKWAQMLVQDPSHHAQVLTAMFGKLPAEPSATLSPEGEITSEANPWAVRWMEDLEALQPYDERSVVQRMGQNVRALFLDRELAADFVAIDVSVLRLQSLSTQVPPWDFREEVGHPMEVSQEGVPQWRCCFDDQCEAKFESFKALATHVLRHHRQMETVSRLVLTNQCPVCLAVYGDRKAAHRHLLSSLRRGSCRDRSRYLGQVHIPQSLCCPVCSAEPGSWSELQLHLAEHLSSVFNGFRNAGMGETQVGRGSAKPGSASGETGGGRRGQRARGSATFGLWSTRQN